MISEAQFFVKETKMDLNQVNSFENSESKFELNASALYNDKVTRVSLSPKFDDKKNYFFRSALVR